MLYHNSLEIALLLLHNPVLTRQTGVVAEGVLESVTSLFDRNRLVVRRATIASFSLLLNLFETKASLRLESAITKVKEDMEGERLFTRLGLAIVE